MRFGRSSTSRPPLSLIRRAFLLTGTAMTLMACAGGPEVEPGVLASALSLQADDSDKVDDRGMLALARELEAKGNYAAAIPLYRHVAAEDETAKPGLARVLLASGNPNGALEALYDLENPSAEVHQLRGQALVTLGQFEAAVAAFEAAGNAPAALRGLGVARAATGDIDGAMDAFAQDASQKGLSNRALLLALTGDAESARTILEAMLESGRAGPRDRQNLAVAYMALGRDRDAERVARIDLDQQATRDTLTFYRTVLALPTAARMRALVTGTAREATTREADGRLVIKDTSDGQLAGQRLVQQEPEPVEEAPIPEPEPEPEPKPAPERPPLPANAPKLLEAEGWALQIGAYRKIERLIQGWEILRNNNLDILENIEPRRSEIDFGERNEKPSGFYYRLNAGPLKTFEEADRICTALKQRGTSCWIRPPEASEGRLPDSD